MRTRLAMLLALAVGSYSTTGLAQQVEILKRYCVRPGFIPPVFDKPFRVPVGCEIIDCCPGCPGDPLIEWRIQIGGSVLQGIEIRFEGLNPQDLGQLSVTGSARIQRDRVMLSRGSSTIGGLPKLLGGRAVMASIFPVIDRTSANRIGSQTTVAARSRDADAGGVRDNVLIQQFVGAYKVNWFHWRPIFIPCGLFPPRLDRLRAKDISGGDNVVVVMDSRTAAGASGCADDQVLRSTGVTNLANLLAAAGCNSEIAIFAADNAMAFDTPVTTWTDARGDLHTSSLQRILDMPVSVWIAENALAGQAPNDVAQANLLYAQNKIGVQFTATITNVSGNAAAVATIGTSCDAVGAVRASAFYTENALNIYYVNDAITGVNCARSTPGDANINYVGTISNVATLAHEIGHAFGLRPAADGGHTNTVTGFANNNIMWGGGPVTRDHLSLGQAFRMNTHTDAWGGTMVIGNGLRPGPGRACSPLTTSATCLALGLDWARP